MKKQLFYILLISLGAQFIYTDSEPRPKGSYTGSCKDITYADGNLGAICSYWKEEYIPTYGNARYLDYRWTGLPNVSLDQKVFNCNGYLTTKPC